MSSFSLSFAASVSAEINDQTHLQQDDERHTDPEFHMSGLVPAKLHSHDGTDAAAKKDGEEQYAFGDPPDMADSLVFIQGIDEKRNDIEDEQIIRKNIRIKECSQHQASPRIRLPMTRAA